MNGTLINFRGLIAKLYETDRCESSVIPFTNIENVKLQEWGKPRITLLCFKNGALMDRFAETDRLLGFS